MINVGRVLANSKFHKSEGPDFVVYRKTGNWVLGRFIQGEAPINFKGVVTAGGTNDIIQVPEGDRTSQIMVFHSTQPIFIAHNEPEFKGTSDEILWNGQRYKIYQDKDWSSFGYYKAIGVSMGGD